MYLEIQEVNEKIFKKALNYFDKNFIKKLEEKSTFKESLIARYLIQISPHFNKKDFTSISHKKNLVFIGVNKSKIGIDIEIIKKRDNSLLNSFKKTEYQLLGGISWENFYYLWTSKESMIKLEGLNLDNINKIILTKCEKIDEKISGIKFSKKLYFKYNGKIYATYTGKKGNKVFSII